MRRLAIFLILAVGPLGIVGSLVVAGQAEETAVQNKKSQQKERRANKALERTRKQVRMLDDIYKGGIVLITEHYVTEDSDLPAGAAFKKLFQSAKDKGWHEVRLLDATGSPYNDENEAADDFEKKAIKALLAGKGWYEETEQDGKKRFLRVATPIPVVMKKCTMCHDNYEGVKEGTPIGALGYRIPIE